MSEIGIIINPYSKKIMKMKTNPVELYQSIGGDLVDVRITNNLDEITEAAEDFKKLGVSYLAISGGDGSIHHVISKFISVYKNENLPRMLVLRDGSMNNIARSYSLKGKGPDLLRKLVKQIIEDRDVKIVFRDTVKAGDMYCFMFGLGFVANYISEFNNGGNKSPLKAFKVMSKAIFSALISNGNTGILERTNLKLIVDDKEIHINDYFGIFAATIANLAISFTPTPRAYEKPGTFHLIATGMTPGEVALNVNKLRRGKLIKHPMHYDNIAEKMTIIGPEKYLYQMDGDIYEASGEMLVETGPRIGFVYL